MHIFSSCARHIVSGELDTGVGEVVAQPHEGDTTGEQTGTTAEHHFLIFVHFPAEAEAWAKHRSALELVVGAYVPTLRSCIFVEFGVGSGGVEEQRHIDAHTVGELEVVGHFPLVLCIEAELAGREGCFPTRIACNVYICHTIAILLNVTGFAVEGCLEIVGSSKVVSTVVVLDKQVGEFVVFVVRTEGEGVVTFVEGHVFGEGDNVLIQSIGSGAAFSTEAHGTATHATDLEHWEHSIGRTRVAHTHIRKERFVAHCG